MNTFLNKLHSTSGLFILAFSLFLGYALDIFIGKGTRVLTIAFALFSLFTIHALVTSAGSNKIVKGYLWVVLIITLASIALDFYWSLGLPESPAGGYLTGFAMVTGIPLVFIGLVGLFRSES